MVFIVILIVNGLSHAETLSDLEKGELIGKLGFNAMVIDAYYEVYLANGTRVDNYLNGLNKLVQKKWGISYSDMATSIENETGRDIRDEAHRLLKTMVKRTGGHDSKGMKLWLNWVAKNYKARLDEFHSVE